METTSDALQNWFQRVRPIYPELFNAAYVICGNYDLAEYAVRSAIIGVWSENVDGGMGFRERLRAALRAEAIGAATDRQNSAVEFTWPGVGDADSDNPIARQAAQETLETQRVVMLRSACGLSTRTIARITGLSASQIHTTLDRFESRCRRMLSGQARNNADVLISQFARQRLAQNTDGIPALSRVYYAFEQEAAQTQVSGHVFSRIAGYLFFTLLCLLCCGIFWVFAVLVQPV